MGSCSKRADGDRLTAVPPLSKDRRHPARRAVGRAPARPLRAGHGRVAGGGPAARGAPHQAIGNRRSFDSPLRASAMADRGLVK